MANLEVDASLDSETYDAGDRVTLSLTLTNAGETELGPLTLKDAAWNVNWHPELLGDDNTLDTEVTIPAGETYERSFTGIMREVDDGQLVVRVSIRAGADHSTTVELTAQVNMTTARFRDLVLREPGLGAGAAGQPDDPPRQPGHPPQLPRRTGHIGRFTFAPVRHGLEVGPRSKV
ncbi:hypothetical protein CLV30_104217 [Haloactinopolyspora alba]|uniref:Uncharacterized protein n=1 Tax=Haloactinopolyspora alba TaxID=648780 RepID=A0A2P8E7C3_9ACTN|nr:hypothetical protein CLV30_104217 [Haloactinopolyspora alba]